MRFQYMNFQTSNIEDHQMGEVVRQGTERLKTDRSGYGSGMRRQTVSGVSTSATPVVLASVAVAEDSVHFIRVSFAACRDTGAEGIGGAVSGSYRRDADGNVTLIGAADTVIDEDSSGSPALTLAANTTDQTIDVTFTGEASKNFNVHAEIEDLACLA